MIIFVFLFLINITISSTSTHHLIPQPLPDVPTTESLIEIYECTREPCIITPINIKNKYTYVILTNKYTHCTINCINGNCNLQDRPLIIYSGCNETNIYCPKQDNGSPNCDHLKAYIGEIPTKILYNNGYIGFNYDANLFSGEKRYAKLNCGSLSCKEIEIYYYGKFNLPIIVNSIGLKSTEKSLIDCTNVINGRCFLNCGDIEYSCIQNNLICSSYDVNECDCVGLFTKDSKKSDNVIITRPDKTLEAHCSIGEMTIYPTGDNIICTSGCDKCIIDCENSGRCQSPNYPKKNLIIYSGAKYTEIKCSGKYEKSCEFITVYVGELNNKKLIPLGYKLNDFNGIKTDFIMNCNKKSGCDNVNINVYGRINNVVISANDIDSFASANIVCIDTPSCQLMCHWEGCAGATFECVENGIRKRDNPVCKCIDYPAPDYFLPEDIKEGPSCPIPNWGKSGNRLSQKTITNNNNNNNNNIIITTNKKPLINNKIIGIICVFILLIFTGIVYCLIYKVNICKIDNEKDLSISLDIINDSYDTFDI